MIGKKAFTALLVLSAFVASIYSPIKILPLTLPMRTSTSPYNTLWNGTSEFYKALVDEGYEVHTVNSLNDIDRLITINDSILYIVIAPDIPFTQVEVERLLNTLSKVRELAFLIADENITSNALLSQLFNISVTGIVLKDKNSPYGPLYPIITCKLNNTEYVIVLNIASYIIIESSKGKDILSKLNDKPVIVYCFTKKYKGIVIADSSIFIKHI